MEVKNSHWLAAVVIFRIKVFPWRREQEVLCRRRVVFFPQMRCSRQRGSQRPTHGVYVCVLLNATCVCVCCYIMYSNIHSRSVFLWPVYSAVLYDGLDFQYRTGSCFGYFFILFQFYFILDAFCHTHTDSPTGGPRTKLPSLFYFVYFLSLTSLHPSIPPSSSVSF